LFMSIPISPLDNHRPGDREWNGLPRQGRPSAELLASLDGDAASERIDLDPDARCAGALAQWRSTVDPSPGVSRPDQLMPPVLHFQQAVPFAQLPSVLARLLSQSGLFWESHVAEWIAGKRSLVALQEELAQQPGAQQNRPDADPMRARAQLAMFDTGAVCLTGPAWSGQSMNLRIDWENPTGAGQDMSGFSDTRLIRATLSLDLPHLGRVSFFLRLIGQVLAVHVESDQPQTWSTHAQELTMAMSRAGLELLDVTVTAEESKHA
jgi:hypothetical protein